MSTRSLSISAHTDEGRSRLCLTCDPKRSKHYLRGDPKIKTIEGELGIRSPVSSSVPVTASGSCVKSESHDRHQDYRRINSRATVIADKGQ